MPEPMTRTLQCGVPMVVENISGVRSASLQLSLPAGSASDKKTQLGRSALWSELLVRGAGGLDSRAQADAFDRLGAGRSVSSGTTYLRLGTTCLDDRLSDTIPLLTAMIREPAFAEDALAPTKDLAIQAIESLADEPQERCVLAARARHHPTPFDRSGMGEIEHLRAMTTEDIRAGWSARALPEGSVVAVAGSFDADAVERDLNAALSGWSGSPEPWGVGQTPARGYAHEEDDSSQVQIIVVHDAPLVTHEDAVLEQCAAGVLSGGMSGRLFTEVREKRGLCYSVSAGYRADRHNAAVTAYVGTTPERAQESLDVLLAELARLKEGVTEDELARVKVGVVSRLIFSGESASARAASIGADQRNFGRPRSLEERAAEYEAVTTDRLNAYLARRVTGRLTIQTLGPDPLTPPSSDTLD